jgi:hypothetical protein
LEKRIAKQLFVMNKRTYEAKDIVERYSNSTQLQKPEQAIMVYLSNRLKSMKMLDIGIDLKDLATTFPSRFMMSGPWNCSKTIILISYSFPICAASDNLTKARRKHVGYQ